MVKVTIKTIKNKKFSMELEDGWSVSDVKTKIQDDLKLGEVSLQKLIHRGKILKNEQSISEIGVKDNDYIVVMVTKKKAPKKKSSPTPTTIYKYTTDNNHHHHNNNYNHSEYCKYSK